MTVIRTLQLSDSYDREDGGNRAWYAEPFESALASSRWAHIKTPAGSAMGRPLTAGVVVSSVICKVASSGLPGGSPKMELEPKKSQFQSCLYRKHPVNIPIQLSYQLKSVVCGLVGFRRMSLVNKVTGTRTGKEP